MTTSSEVHEYVPGSLHDGPLHLPSVHSEWRGLERLVPDLIERFGIGRNLAIEFGVWYGYSAAALANFFDHVVAVDTFEGDDHAGRPTDLYTRAVSALFDFPNVYLFRRTWQDYTASFSNVHADLIHIDIVHTYEETYACGDWACAHADLVIFHDTEAFPDVRRAVHDLAVRHNRVFWNYPHHHGLGILGRER